MDTALNPAAHRSDARLHVLGPSSSTSPQTLRVRAIFHLSVAGRRASLLTGGNGRRRQRLTFRMPASRMHLVHVDHGGTAFLKLRPRLEMRPDQRVVRIDASPVYDAVRRDAAAGRRSQSRARGRVSRAGCRLSIGTARRHANLADTGRRIISPRHDPACARASGSTQRRRRSIGLTGR